MFPEIGVPPVIIHFQMGISSINRPAIGVPPWLWKPINMLQKCKGTWLDFDWHGHTFHATISIRNKGSAWKSRNTASVGGFKPTSIVLSTHRRYTKYDTGSESHELHIETAIPQNRIYADYMQTENELLHLYSLHLLPQIWSNQCLRYKTMCNKQSK